MTKRKLFRATDGYSAADMLRYARDHFSAAQHLYRARFEYFDSAAYLAHLAVEILLKACLLHLSGAFSDTHILRDLVKDIRNAGGRFDLANSDEMALYLLDYFAASRYPVPAAPVQVGSADLATISAFWNHCVSQLPADLVAAYEGLPAGVKGGRQLMVKNAAS